MILPDCGGASYRTRLNLEKYFKPEFGPKTGHDYIYIGNLKRGSPAKYYFPGDGGVLFLSRIF